MCGIQHLLSIEAVELVPENQQGVYSIFFTVPKRNGNWRAILDLKFVDRFICLRHFNMESLRSITEALQPQEFLTSLDLMEAYLHIPIFPGHRWFLRFCVADIHVQVRALPLSLSTARRVFTKIPINPIAHLRQQGVHIHAYLNDLLIHSSSAEQVWLNMPRVLECLQNHGFLLNLDKSEVVPRQVIQYLGVIIDTRSSYLFQDRKNKTRTMATSN